MVKYIMSNIKIARIYKAVVYGTIIGILDVMPMVAKHMSIWANLSAFTHWIIVSLFIATANLNFLTRNSIIKGILIAFLLLIPTALVIWPSDTTAIMPMSLSTLIFGGLLGWLLQ